MCASTCWPWVWVCKWRLATHWDQHCSCCQPCWQGWTLHPHNQGVPVLVCSGAPIPMCPKTLHSIHGSWCHSLPQLFWRNEISADMSLVTLVTGHLPLNYNRKKFGVVTNVQVFEDNTPSNKHAPLEKLHSTQLVTHKAITISCYWLPVHTSPITSELLFPWPTWPLKEYMGWGIRMLNPSFKSMVLQLSGVHIPIADSEYDQNYVPHKMHLWMSPPWHPWLCWF